MSSSELKSLCLALAQAENEEEVVGVLQQASLWEDEGVWKDMDESSGNWSTIGNQQSAPDTALVEKVINSVDAVLTRECLRQGISPHDKRAPQSIAEAQKRYFGIHNGKLSSIDASSRAQLSENIMLVATGGKRAPLNPCYSIIDLGEGQSPSDFPNTFLSLNRGNKNRTLFVQGKFGMGGTGIFRFGSPKHNLQLVISKRDPRIDQKFKSSDAAQWGFTVIRRKSPIGQMRSSIFTYLAPGGKVPSFTAPSLPLLPGGYPNAYEGPLHYGTFIKIYEYELTGLKTNILFDLYNRLSLLTPGIALPIRMFERRSGYKGHSFETTMAGLSVRLDEDKRENLEEGFPSSGEIRIHGEPMDFLIYVFKKGQAEKYARSEGVVFSVNGQAHGFLPRYFFSRKGVKMSYLADSILVIVDCSKISRRMQEDLFMNSRDRLSGGSLQAEIESKLEEVISNHPGLRALTAQRRREEIENKLQDSKPLAEVIEKIIKNSPTLSQLFIQGIRIKNPFGLVDAKSHGELKQKRFPTFFRLTKAYEAHAPKRCPINQKFRVQFETDAENDYFNRDEEPGQFSLTAGGVILENFSINLWNGLATLTAELSPEATVGDKIQFQSMITDNSRVDPFYNDFYVVVAEAQSARPGGHGQRKSKPNGEEGEDRKQPSALDLPNIVELRKTDINWREYFKEDADALVVIDSGDEGYDFFLNMDNVYLLTEMKGVVNSEPRLLEARFKYGMVLVGVSLLEHFEQGRKQRTQPDDIPASEKVREVSRAISPILLPMIASLGDLEMSQE